MSEEAYRQEAPGGQERAVPPPPPPPPPGARPPRLVRRTDDKVIAGLCSGLGAYLGIDPVVFRLAFVLLAFTGAGVLLYLLGWIVVPPARPGELGQRPSYRDGGDTRLYVGAALVLLALAMMAGAAGVSPAGLVWGLGLIALGILLFRQSGTQAAPPPAGAEPPPAAPSQAGPAAPGQPPAPAAPPAWDAPPPPAPPGGERPPVGWLTVAALLITLGLATLLDSLDVVEVEAWRLLGLALTVVGLGLVVGSLLGRRSLGLIVLGTVLAPLALLAGLAAQAGSAWIGGAVPRDWGERVYRPTTLDALRSGYRLGAGQLTLDLTRVPFGAGDTEAGATLGTGELLVIVPDSVPVVAEASVGVGEVELFGESQSGAGISTRAVSGPAPEGGRGTLRLQLRNGFGSIEVRRAGPFPPPPEPPPGAPTTTTAAG